MLRWNGIDNGREGLLRREKWFKVLEILSHHEGENHTDLNSPLFDELELRLPGNAWRGSDGHRSLFRDYQTAWTNLRVLTPTAESDGYIELTSRGKELVDHPENLTEFFRDFMDHYLETWEVDGRRVLVAPFLILAATLMGTSPVSVLALQDQSERRIKIDLGTTAEFSDTQTTRRRFRTYLRMLVNSEVAQLVGQDVVVEDRDYLQSALSAGGLASELPGVLPPLEPEISPLDDLRRRVVGQRVVREGQLQFRTDLLAAYGGTCAITEATEPRVLEAAHIMPYMGRHTNRTSNGLLLAVDIHRLFDDFVLTINPDTFRVLVHASVSDERYRSLDGREVRLPGLAADSPDRLALAYHFDQFTG